jgi:hypothetical protein
LTNLAPLSSGKNGKVVPVYAQHLTRFRACGYVEATTTTHGFGLVGLTEGCGCDSNRKDEK